jgi:hypothetical protein
MAGEAIAVAAARNFRSLRKRCITHDPQDHRSLDRNLVHREPQAIAAQ